MAARAAYNLDPFLSSRDEIVAFYKEHVEGAHVMTADETAMIMAEPSDGVTVQIVCTDDADSGKREITITTTREKK